MGNSAPTRIHLIGNGRHEEAVAGGTIKPGHLIMLNSSGQVVVHNDNLGWAEKAFALEDALQGKTIADSYASGDQVGYVLALSGDVIYAYLSGGEIAVIGSQLVSDGTGALKPATDSDIAEVRLAVALEAVDASDSNDVDERIKVRVL